MDDESEMLKSIMLSEDNKPENEPYNDAHHAKEASQEPLAHFKVQADELPAHTKKIQEESAVPLAKEVQPAHAQQSTAAPPATFPT